MIVLSLCPDWAGLSFRVGNLDWSLLGLQDLYLFSLLLYFSSLSLFSLSCFFHRWQFFFFNLSVSFLLSSGLGK